MRESIRAYLLAIVAVCMLTALVCALLEKSRLQKIAKLIGGALLLLVVVMPLLRLDGESVAGALENLTGSAAFDSAQTAQNFQTRLRALVKENTERCIEEKAETLGGIVQAEVTLDFAEAPSPVAAVITGTLTPQQADALGEFLKDSLGIQEVDWKLYG